MSTDTLAAKTTPDLVEVRLVDADVHPTIALDVHASQVSEYIPEPWRSQFYSRRIQEIEVPSVTYLPPGQFQRRDTGIPDGGGETDEIARLIDEQLLLDVGVDYALLDFLRPRPHMHNPEWETALFRGHNQWQAESWSPSYNWHDRFRGHIKVCPMDPHGAVADIERWAGHPYFIGISMQPELSTTLGRPEFEPLFAAAERHGLPIYMHITMGVGMNRLTPVGYPSYYLSVMGNWPLYFMSQLASLVFEGVFERHPGLKIVCAEGGFAWLAPLMWRLDRVWKALGGAYPQCKRAPSEYIREHVRVTTQPVEEAESRTSLQRMIEWMGDPGVLMFSTDYPHYDYDDPTWVTRQLPPDFRDSVMYKNALDLYGLPSTRPFDSIDQRRADASA